MRETHRPEVMGPAYCCRPSSREPESCPFPVVTVAEARDQVLNNRRLVRNGIHPLIEKRRAQIQIFKDAAIDTYESLRSTWKSRHTEKMWLQPIEKHAIPVIGYLSVDQITEDHLLEILRAQLMRLWDRFLGGDQ